MIKMDRYELQVRTASTPNVELQLLLVIHIVATVIACEISLKL